jgi:hypothetical protein
LSDLWRSDDVLPVLPFKEGGGERRQVAVDPAFDYLGFRERLFAAVRPYDLHVNDAGRAYLLATGLVALAGLGALAARPAGRPVERPAARAVERPAARAVERPAGRPAR